MIFSMQTIVDFALILLVHALGLDHHTAPLIFRPNLLKQAKSEGFFKQRKIRKTHTACEGCVRLAAYIGVVQCSSQRREAEEPVWGSLGWSGPN